MACEAVQLWSFSSLIAAFIDLTIAYALLSASTLAFIASRFLIFFGLNLPCPSHGLFFGICSESLCLNRLLFDFPIQKLSAVVLYVKQAYPFSGCICNRTSSYSIAANDSSNSVLQTDCDASCSNSISDTRRSIDSSGGDRKDLIFRPEKYDVKRTAIARRRPKSRLRLRRKQGDGHGKHLPYDGNRGEEASIFVVERQLARTTVLMNGSPDEVLCNEEMSSSLKLCDDSQGDLSSSGDEKRAVRLLERALEEERASRARLYIELEKERSASAIAADEAMSMILRLQEEKASIEMEARQYQRIIEEKSAYDAEEMNILVEILVRREKEKLFLEKEVEGYRQMISIAEDYDDGKFFQTERSFHQGHGDLPENSMQMGGDRPHEYNFVKKSDSSDMLEDEEVENLSPEEKIIVTCDGTDTGNPYTDSSRADSSQVLHDKGCVVPIGTSIAKGLKTIPDHPCSSSITDNGINVDRSSMEITKPKELSLLTELRRSSMSCADDEVARLLEKLKFIREDRVKLISLSIMNQELGSLGDK